ncbi:MAG TPA: alpha-glucuronidase family glycosyl hydrolase [Sedimentisphaerales bacterium]|nr:alpha-glucuronidase family glycosyl hydrolase [Sedimentisphaerales bacterium]
MLRKESCLAVAVLVLSALISVLSADALAGDTVTIVSPKDATLPERLAAREIRRYLYLRTGRLLPVVQNRKKLPSEADLIVIARKDRGIVRDLSGKNAALKSSLASLGPQQYQLTTLRFNGQRAVLIAGGDSAGTLYGTYRFVEHFGVRYYLHGDTIPDAQIPLELPELYERGGPLFELRGIQPFHDFPEGPDWWSTDDYKAVIAQLAKLRMNFIGLHTYPEGSHGPEPTVWIGLADDIEPDGKVKFSYVSSYANSLRGTWGYAPKRTGEYVFGADQLFERDDYGPEVMSGMVPFPETPQQSNELFNRTGRMLKEAFEYAHALGIKTCVGTETPLTIPNAVKDRIKALGQDPSDPFVVEQLYKGMFKRIIKAYPLDYYWLWTPEGWTLAGAKEEQVLDTQRDLLTAVGAVEDVGAPFTLATCGWVLGPPQDRARFDRVLPKHMPFSCINRNLGFEPVEPNFARLQGRPKWAIPWLEDDPAMIIPQLWAGRMRKDAVEALKYGCTGLMGIHWRTRILGPNVSALAHAAWEQTGWKAQITDDRTQRDMPVEDFYQDWALTQFGPEAAGPIARLFARLDGGPPAVTENRQPANLPRPSTWVRGPGGIRPDERPWEAVRKEYAFVSEMALLRGQIKGAGNLERFDYWLNNFRYMQAIGKVNSTWARFNAAMEKVRAETDAQKRKELAREIALPIRKELVSQLEEVHRYLLGAITTTGGMGNVANWQQHNLPALITEPGKQLAEILGQDLPADAMPSHAYDGSPRMFVPTARTSLMAGEDLKLKVIVLAANQPKEAVLYWRPIGEEKYEKISLKHIARSVYSALLPAGKIKDSDFEYHVKISLSAGSDIYLPAAAPQVNHTVVVISPD